MTSSNDCDNKGQPCEFELAFPKLLKNETTSGDPNSVQEQLELYVRDRVRECTEKFEVFEETGLDVDHMDLRAIIHISMPQPPGVMLFVFMGEASTRSVLPSS